MTDFIFLGSKITADGDSSHEIKKTLAPWKKSMTNLLLLLLLLSHFSRFRLCDPIDGSPPGSAIPGIFQARVLEWVAIAFSDDQPRQHIKKQRHYFRDITLLTKVWIVKAMVFPVVVYGCESWTMKKAEH